MTIAIPNVPLGNLQYNSIKKLAFILLYFFNEGNHIYSNTFYKQWVKYICVFQLISSI